MGETDAAPGYLTGSARPVEREVEAVDLPVTSRLPGALSGVYVRNGPNPTSGDPGHWFFGDGMLHGVRLEGGRAAWYRHRWVRTSTFTDGVPVRDPATGAPDYRARAANTSVVRHAGRTMALVESSFPQLVDAELATLGPYDFDGRPSGPGRVPSEPTFVPVDADPGGPGWLLGFVYDAATASSELCVWDVDDITGEPVARVGLPQRVPDGFHGTWLADA